MKRLIKKFVTLGFVLTMLTLGVKVGYAINEHVWGQLRPDGGLVQYDRIRTHTFNGPIGLNITVCPYGYLRLGLRDMRRGGVQFTESLQWNGCGYQQWNDILQGTRFAFQGRMAPWGPIGRSGRWEGILNY